MELSGTISSQTISVHNTICLPVTNVVALTAQQLLAFAIEKCCLKVFIAFFVSMSVANTLAYYGRALTKPNKVLYYWFEQEHRNVFLFRMFLSFMKYLCE
jgi:hypothetical protein